MPRVNAVKFGERPGAQDCTRGNMNVKVLADPTPSEAL
jgi:hypothetical protein